MHSPLQTPTWVSKRRFLEQRLSTLQKCTNLSHLKQIHAQIFKMHLHHDPFVTPKLVSAFSVCHRIDLSIKVFDQAPEPNTLLFNTLIRAHSTSTQALSTFISMRRSGMLPDTFTYPTLLKSCSGKHSLSLVKMVHTHVVKFGFLAFYSSDIFVPNSLIDAYSKCGPYGIDSAKQVFADMGERDVVSYNSIVSGLVRSGKLADARQMFDEMPLKNAISWNTILDGHMRSGDIQNAYNLFLDMPERNHVAWTTMISGYAKDGDMDMARVLFDKMPTKNIVTWTIMISSYAKRGDAIEAIGLYDLLERTRLMLDNLTFVSILSACAESGLYSLGERVHTSIRKSGYKCSLLIMNTLVDMYAKCGSLDEAYQIFLGMSDRDLVSWNTMILGLAMHGRGKEAHNVFNRMRQEGVKPDKVTFVGILSACTHSGFIDKGVQYFNEMERVYGVVPNVEHYGCMVDLLGRGGHLKEALRMVHSMPFEPNTIIWGTLLGACRMHNNMELADDVFNRLVELEPSNAESISMGSNIYAAAGDWDSVAGLRIKMRSQKMQKSTGRSFIEVDGDVHEFTVFDMSHPKSDEIYKMVDCLSHHLKKYSGELLKH